MSSVQPSQSKARYMAASSRRTAHSSADTPAGLRRSTFSLRSIEISAKEKARVAPALFTLSQGTGLLAHHFAEANPFLAVELDELHRLDRREVIGSGVHLDARQQRLDAEILQACGLLH